jgi:hypothetical protein
MTKKITDKAIRSLHHCSKEQLEEILRDALLEIYRLTVVIQKLGAKDGNESEEDSRSTERTLN